MIGGLKPYPEYKESGVPWLGRIPVHWEVGRIKYLLREIDSRSTSGRETLLSVSQYTGVTPRRKNVGDDGPDTRARSLVGYKNVRPGDLVVNIMLAWNGSLGVSPDAGIVSPAYCVYRFMPDAIPGYFDNLLRAPLYKGRIKASSTGVVESRLRLYSDALYRIEALLPPREEQYQIARFINACDHRVNRAIRAKRALIALLNEQKQTMIQRAVTRGVNRDVRLKPSGISWVSDIPGHWAVSRLKFETSHIVDCLHATPKYVHDGEFRAIRTADIEPGKVRLETARRVSKEHYALWTSRLAPREGDVLYSREGERYGIAALVPAGVDLCISQRMMVFRIRPPQQSPFMMWQLNCPHVYAQASADTIGATSPHVNVEQIKNFKLALPPPAEQQQISLWISAQLDPIHTAIARAQNEIDLVREYRTRLVSDVVTGQVDVREVSHALPAETEGPNILVGGDVEDESEELLEAVADHE